MLWLLIIVPIELIWLLDLALKELYGIDVLLLPVTSLFLLAQGTLGIRMLKKTGISFAHPVDKGGSWDRVFEQGGQRVA